MNDKINSLAYAELAYYVCDDAESKEIYKSDVDIITNNIILEKTSGIS